MILAGPHAEAVARAVGELVPLAEATFPILRRPLADRLTAGRAAAEAGVLPHGPSVLALYGLGALDTAELAARAQAEVMARLDS